MEKQEEETTKDSTILEANQVDLPIMQMPQETSTTTENSTPKTESDLAITKLFSNEQIPQNTENIEKKDSDNSKKNEKSQLNKTIWTSGIALSIVLVLSFAGFYFFNGSGITGLVVGDPTEHSYEYNQEYTTSTETTLGFQSIQGLKITGTLEGSGARVTLKTPTREYLVANITGTQGSTYTLSTDKKEYNLGETVNIILTPEPSIVSIYLQKGEQNNILSERNVTPNETGEYTILALVTTENDILRLEVNITIKSDGAQEGAGDASSASENGNLKTFTSLCLDSCILQEEISTPILAIELDEGSILSITDITTLETEAEQPPIQTATIPDITLNSGEAYSLELKDYFSDPDGNTLQFDVSQANEITASIIQDTLSITGTTPGEYILHVYASDTNNMITGNDFTITITTNETTQNNTINETENPTNNTTNTTIIQPTNITTNETAQPILTDCNNPNPNLRPIYCIEGSEDKYFNSVPIYLENADRVPMGRFTAFGNLIIQGILVENSQSTPKSNDFRISYIAGDGETEISTAWIDSETGNIHLLGKLYEEQMNLVPPGTEAYNIQNKKGTTLGYFEKYTGNLHLRGNLVTEKPDLE